MGDLNSIINGDVGAFESLLQMLMSPQNEERAAAEQAFSKLKEHPEPCASQLIRSLKSSSRPECRSLSAVLLRKVGVIVFPLGQRTQGGNFLVERDREAAWITDFVLTVAECLCVVSVHMSGRGPPNEEIP